MTGRIEKRRHHRFMALLAIRVVGDRAGAFGDLKLVTLDIALGGARCAANRSLPAGTVLRLALTLEGGGLLSPESIDLDAEVLRCREATAPDPNRGFEIALQFVRMEPAERKRLQHYLNNL